MKDQEIKSHLILKEKNRNYPKLPKFILKKEEKYDPNNGLHKASLQSFYNRLKNWRKDHETKINDFV